MSEPQDGERKVYNRGGDHTANFVLAARLREIYRQERWNHHYGKRELTEWGLKTEHEQAHDHAIEMILVKIARIATGDVVEDNYVDIRGYAELARMSALRAKEEGEQRDSKR